MTDSDDALDALDALDAISRASTELLPQLSERLTRHGLAEIEVRQGDLRLRVVSNAPHDAPVAAGAGSTPGPTVAPSVPVGGERSGRGIVSPAVGFFIYADGLGPGLAVEVGDSIGHVEMLGVRHEVRAPRRGQVRNLVAESGEAVEYGQVVAEMDVGEPVR